MTQNPDLVSVLMPAFKPEHFKPALESVVNQTHTNLEILVGDNSGDPAIQAVIDEVGDPRVIRIPNHAVSGKSPRLNHMILWLRAKGRYARFVYDDDLVYERSTEVLLHQLKTVPRCVLAWHQRDVIDEHGALRWRHGVLPEDGSAVLDRRLLLDNMAKFLNFVGEPSFTMFDREAIAHFDFNRYARFDMAFLWDIAMYLGIAENGLAAGVGEFLGGFRLHSGQVSSAANVFGAVEWELVFREELCNGNLNDEQFNTVLPKILGLYQASKGELPVLEGFQSRLAVDAHTGRLRETMPQFRDAYRSLLAARH
jgi:glycosyltransferase involved in cell wall biosynthesis